MTPIRLADLHAALGGDSTGELIGDGSQPIDRIAPLESAGPGSITFATHARLLKQVQASSAACIIVPPALKDAAQARGGAIVAADPYLYFARLTQWWAALVRPAPVPGVHPSAVIGAGARLGQNVVVGPQAVIEDGAELEDGVVVGAQCFIGAGVRIGAGTRLAPHVTLMTGTRIGARCLLHSGAVIGADGFGFAPHDGGWVKIEQLGGVSIGDDVEIGANTCIDRGALGDTVIENGAKLDNLIQIAHNVRIGERTAMAANTGVAGSTTIGKGCLIGGAANIIGHARLADGVNITATTFVSRSLDKPGWYSGSWPLDDNASWEKNAATVRQLYKLRDRIRTLEKKLDQTAAPAGAPDENKP